MTLAAQNVRGKLAASLRFGHQTLLRGRQRAGGRAGILPDGRPNRLGLPGVGYDPVRGTTGGAAGRVDSPMALRRCGRSCCWRRASVASAQVEPDPLIAPVVFHWAQVQTAWPTLEGGAIGPASLPFWRRQITLLETAGCTGQLFQVADGTADSQRNHLRALRDRRLEQPAGPLPPRVVPFFEAASYPGTRRRKTC